MREKNELDELFNKYKKSNSKDDLKKLFFKLNPWLYELVWLFTRNKSIAIKILKSTWAEFAQIKNSCNTNEIGIEYFMFQIIKNNEEFWNL